MRCTCPVPGEWVDAGWSYRSERGWVRTASIPKDTGSSSDARPPKRRDREVLDAAAKVFYERGYANASVQDVADALGILKGSLYHYIDTKEDLLYRLLEETQRDVHSILDEVAALDGLDALERLRLYVRRQVEFNIENLAKVSVFYHDLQRLSPDRRASIVARRRQHEAFVVELIEELQREGRADASLDSHVLSRCLFATIIWTYRWYNPKRDSRDDVVDLCATFALAGIGVRRGARS